MSAIWKHLVTDNTQATNAHKIESVQTLWSGYGEIFRVQLVPESLGTLIIKQVIPPTVSQHPRGWNTDRSSTRKLKSYEVEANWYTEWSHLCNSGCRVAASIATASSSDSTSGKSVGKSNNQSWILMEDLDASGYNIRHSGLTPEQTKPCLRWLASFHACFLQTAPTGLWQVGTYWHLDTRPDELEAMQNSELKDNAAKLDHLLRDCKYQSLVHGDAKVANFCFDRDSQKVAAVDFQYVGGGCGMKDVAYFFGSCFNEAECEKYVPDLLDYYFIELQRAVLRRSVDHEIDHRELEREWRALFAPAWTDFYRFLSGWMPEHAKIHRFTEKLARQTLASDALQQIEL